MLSDFYKIKDELNIAVNGGSFVTLRDPIKYCGKKFIFEIPCC
jgi:hypothetical protein